MIQTDIIKFKQGDQSAFKNVYDAYWAKVFHFTSLYVNDPFEREEVVQQVFIRLWEKRESIDESVDLDGYLFIITRNMIFNRSRRSFNEKAYKEAMEAIGSDSYTLDAQIEARDLNIYIEKLVALLPDRQREAFILSRKNGLTAKEIAQRMGISQKGVERHIHLALKFIKSNLPLLLIFLQIR